MQAIWNTEAQGENQDCWGTMRWGTYILKGEATF